MFINKERKSRIRYRDRLCEFEFVYNRKMYVHTFLSTLYYYCGTHGKEMSKWGSYQLRSKLWGKDQGYSHYHHTITITTMHAYLMLSLLVDSLQPFEEISQLVFR